MKAELAKRRQKQHLLKKKLQSEAEHSDRELRKLESQRKHRCVYIRNEYIGQRINMDFARRQRKLSCLAEGDKDKYDGSVEVFPVCAAGFQELLKEQKPLPGFPSKVYTGVPRLRQWLSEAVFTKREAHWDSMLRGLQRLHDGIRRWSDDSSEGMVTFSRQDVESLLQFSHDKHQNVCWAHCHALELPSALLTKT